MSTLATTNIKHPSSASNNVVLDSGGGATFGQIKGGAITSGTAVASTSGTSIDFTSIPSWVKRITVMFDGVSTNGASQGLLRIGAGSITTTGYTSQYVLVGISTTNGTDTTGFGWFNSSAAESKIGHLTLTNISGNSWVLSGLLMVLSGFISTQAGSITLSGTLDRVRITTVNGTDTFDAGTINILYEG